jgi:hypothetical protein
VVSFSLHQVTSLAAQVAPKPPLYQVTNEVVAATDASPAVYVFQTTTQKFTNYASAADMAQWPDSLEKAQVIDAAFYRLPKLVRSWDTVMQMNTDLAESVRRLQSLADEMNASQGTIIIDRTTTVVGA